MQRAFREHAGQQEREDHGEPAVDRKAGIEMERMRRSRNALGDGADDDAEQLQREQRPGDRLQTVRVRGDERVAAAHRLDDREQPLEDDVVQRDRARPSAAIARNPVIIGRISEDGEMPSAVNVHCSATIVAIRSVRMATPNSQLRTIQDA